MLAKRIIPCLDVSRGRVVKGVKFVNLRDTGDPIEMALVYDRAGADELMVLDIAASDGDRGSFVNKIQKITNKISIPLAVGGGIKKLKDAEQLFSVGTDKFVLGSGAYHNPGLIEKIADKYGPERLVVSIDARHKAPELWEVYTQGGQRSTGLNVIKWASEVESRGAGEILLTSMDRDGTKNGYDLTLTSSVREAVNIPVIASGGAGGLNHFLEALTIGRADAVLAASTFHYGE